MENPSGDHAPRLITPKGPPRAKTGLSRHAADRSAPGGEADQNPGKADIADGMSEVGGTPDLPWTRPEGPFIAKNGLSPHHNNRNVAHRDAGGGRRRQHQKQPIRADDVLAVFRGPRSVSEGTSSGPDKLQKTVPPPRGAEKGSFRYAPAHGHLPRTSRIGQGTVVPPIDLGQGATIPYAGCMVPGGATLQEGWPG